MAGVGERKTLACLGNYGSFSVAELWRARKWVVRNEAGELNSHLINYVEEFAYEQVNCFKLESVMITLDLQKNPSGCCVEDWERRNRVDNKEVPERWGGGFVCLFALFFEAEGRLQRRKWSFLSDAAGKSLR